jgi:uncharacterized protein
MFSVASTPADTARRSGARGAEIDRGEGLFWRGEGLFDNPPESGIVESAEWEMNLGQHILVFGVRMYRWVISPAKLFLFGSLSRCRFNPSCSAYALEAISRHGVCHGTMLAVKRICRCHPWGGCGDDPVPPLKPVHQSDQNQVRLAITTTNSRAASGARRLSVAGQSGH